MTVPTARPTRTPRAVKDSPSMAVRRVVVVVVVVASLMGFEGDGRRGLVSSGGGAAAAVSSAVMVVGVRDELSGVEVCGVVCGLGPEKVEDAVFIGRLKQKIGLRYRWR